MRIVQIVRESIHPGAAPAYEGIERDAARLSAELGCPHTYLSFADTPITTVWWINSFESREQLERVGAAYAENAALLEMLEQTVARKAALVSPAISYFAEHQDGPEFDPESEQTISPVESERADKAASIYAVEGGAPAAYLLLYPEGTASASRLHLREDLSFRA